MLDVRRMLVLSVSSCIVGQIVRPFGEKYSDAIMDKLKRHEEHNYWTDYYRLYRETKK
ncbi:MAG: hypothetical protein E6Z06_02785 [Clostridiales bacterium]|nr:hypothetical protein [Clostridiales bacterium]